MKLQIGRAVILVGLLLSSFGFAGVDDIKEGHLVSPLNSDQIFVVAHRDGSVLKVRRVDQQKMFESVAPLEGTELRPIFNFAQNDQFLAPEQTDLNLQEVQRMVIDFDAQRQPMLRLVGQEEIVQTACDDDAQMEELLDPVPVQKKKAGCCGCFGLGSF